MRSSFDSPSLRARLPNEPRLQFLCLQRSELDAHVDALESLFQRALRSRNRIRSEELADVLAERGITEFSRRPDDAGSSPRREVLPQLAPMTLDELPRLGLPIPLVEHSADVAGEILIAHLGRERQLERL